MRQSFGSAVFLRKKLKKMLTFWFIHDKLKLWFTGNKPKGGIYMDYELGEVQLKFADLLWKNEPVASGELVKICEKELEWKKSTTYTVLRKLCQKGIFKNENGVVTSVLSKDEYYSAKSEQFVEESFGGSLPAFLAAFSARKKLSETEIDEIQKMITDFKKGR